MARGFWILLLSLLLVSAVGCAMREEIRGQETTGLDRKLSTFAFVEEGDLITLIVDTKAARYREGQAYIPFEICVANNGVRMLELTRESFELIDEQGNRYPLATPRELIDNYDFLDPDRNFAELEGIVFNKFATYTRYRSKFSPTRGGSLDLFDGTRSNPGRATELIRDRLSVPRFGYIIDYLYFPAPKTGVLGKKFELFLSSRNLEDPVFVRFLVKE